MNKTPPPTPGLPPIIPPPIPTPPRPKSRLPLVIALVLGVVVLVASPFVVGLFLAGLRLNSNPSSATSGEAAFREANRQIIANRGTVAFGNNPEAITLARDYSRSLKILRDGFFTEGNKNAYSMAKGEFLTYCQLNGDACVFLVHVPELRRFTRDAKESLTELAWINAQAVLKAGTSPPPSTVAVGVKGAMLYEAILIGDFVPEPQGKSDGIKTRGSGIQANELLFPFFAVEDETPREEPKVDALEK